MAFPSSPSSPRLLAGAAVADLTPRGPVFLYGYPHVPRMSTGVNDPLECAALFLQADGGSALFLANDLIGVTRAFVAGVRRRIATRTGVSEDAIVVTATHTHSGPVMADHVSNAADPVVPKPDAAYLEFAAERMADAAERAVRSAVPAEAGLAVARAEDVGSNRHDPLGPSDPEVPVLVARAAADGRPIGCMVVCGMHPTVLHEDSTLISADFPGFARQYLRQTVLPAACPVVYHNGASGNQSPRHVARANTFAEAKRLGENLGRAMATAVKTIDYRRELRIGARRMQLALAPRAFPPVAAAMAAVEQARERFARLKRDGAPRAEVRTAECDMFGAEETAELARAAADGRRAAAIAGCSPAEIQAIAIGPWHFVAWPGEFFVEYGLELKARAPGTFLITLANGELQGYIATPEADARGAYEARNAVFAPANGPRMIEATVRLLASDNTF